MIELDDFYDPEEAEWIRMTPQERFAESERLWQVYLSLGGSLDPEPDSDSPFFDEEEWRTLFAHGRSGVHLVRRSGV
jgi:hypothetical protein